MDESQVQDICRVCRSEATPEKPLYHPCICTGSIKFIHQECLLQWLKYSRKEYCELCSHRFSFMPIYSPDMPKRLPIKDIVSGLLCSLGTAVRFWLHYTLVAVAWLGIVPLTACRIYRCLFTGSLSSIITLPFDILSTENVLSDSLYGCFVVTCTLCAFISLVWLREQIIHGGGPEWLEHEHDILHVIDPPAENPNNNLQMNINIHLHAGAPGAPANPILPSPLADSANQENSSSSTQSSLSSSNTDQSEQLPMSSFHSAEHDESSSLNSAHHHSHSDDFVQLSSAPPSDSLPRRQSSGSSNFMQHQRSPSPPPGSRHQFSSSPENYTTFRQSSPPPSSSNFSQYPRSSSPPPNSLHHRQSPSPVNVQTSGSSNFSQHERSPSPTHNSQPQRPVMKITVKHSSPSGTSSFNQDQSSSSPPSSSRNLHPLSSGDFVAFRRTSPLSNSGHHSHSSMNSGDFASERRSSPSPPPDHHHHHHHSSGRHSSSSPPPNYGHHRRTSLPSANQLQAVADARNSVRLSATIVGAVPIQTPHPLPGDSDDDQNHPVLDNDDDVDANEGNNGAEDVNFNPIEWDHAAEELTWERLLGLDGSLVFLEHVFWVVSLNTLFIVVFAFFPYHIGQISLSCFGFKEYVRAPEFEGLLTTLFGYINIGIVLALLHFAAALVRLNRTQRLLGICYVVIKVSLLSVIEIGIFPLVCGWWLDICSLTLLDATLQDREAGFKLAPGTSMFIHWLAGMVYVFYFASFILLLREVLRPGVLWFLKNLNDPDFNPIQEMIHSPILRHIRRVLISLVTFGTTILLVVWLPVRIIEKIAPTFLPYQVMLANDMPYSELSLELVLLQVVLPALLEQGHMRNWLKFSVRSWCIGVSYILDIRSYLLGDVNLDEQGSSSNVPAPAPEPNDGIEGLQAQVLAAAHQALFQPVSPAMFQPYKRPKFLPFKIVCLIFFICISLTMGSLVMFTVPVYIGRKVMSMWLGNTKIHELYTLGCGMYVCWLALRLTTLLWSWIPKGWASISKKLKELLFITVKLLCAMSMLLVVIPVLMGLTLDMIVTVPARVALNQTPLISLWQDWAIGVLLTKTFFAVVLVGPDWWMKHIIEMVYLGGIRNINLKLIFVDLSMPIVITLGLSLSVPYIIACSIIPMFTSNFELQNTVLRRIYPALLAFCLVLEAVIFHVRQFRRMYEHIRNDKYLVGKRLVNYEHRRLPEVSQPKEEASTAS